MNKKHLAGSRETDTTGGANQAITGKGIQVGGVDQVIIWKPQGTKINKKQHIRLQNNIQIRSQDNIKNYKTEQAVKVERTVWCIEPLV